MERYRFLPKMIAVYSGTRSLLRMMAGQRDIYKSIAPDKPRKDQKVKHEY